MTASWSPPRGAATRVILVRHGSTVHSAPRLFSGRNDLPLNAEGERQAQALGERLRRVRDVAAVVSSPLPRAMQTARAIADEVTVAEGFIELDFGDWEGLSATEVTEKWPAEFAAFAGGDAAAPGGESFAEVADRVAVAAAELVERHPRGTVIVVSHVTPIKTLLRLALDAPQSAMFRMHLDTASISTLDYFDTSGASMRLFNDTSHLSPH